MLIDSHAHLHPGPAALESLLDSMRRLDIDRSLVVGGGLVSPAKIQSPGDAAGQPKFDHAGLLAQCSLAERRLLPFYFANPFLAPDEYRNIGRAFSGLKLGPVVYPVPINSAGTRAYVSIANELAHPVYLHCLDRDQFRVADLATLAADFPTVVFILGHGGIGHLDFQAVDTISPLSNVCYETSGAFKAAVKYACAKLGPGRVLFGSEHPLQSASAELAKIRDLDLPPHQLDLVTSGNINRILARKPLP
jgi:predicted TIM-barrel fold metal-dependent hydrolase